jgi:restriction endonuclease S subunit
LNVTPTVVRRAQLESTLRIDPEYYDPEYASLEHDVIATDSYLLWRQIDGEFVTGPFGSEFNVENYVANSNFRYVRGRDVKEFFLLDDDNVYISEKDYKRLNEYSLSENDILVSAVGTLGNAAIVDSKSVPAIFSCKSTLFRTKAVNPYYLLAYLNCRYGKTLLQRRVRGAVQTGLNIDDLKSLPIFLPSNRLQDKIAKTVLNAQTQLQSARAYRVKANELVVRKFGLVDFKIQNQRGWVVPLSETLSEHRTDAEYYQPKFKQIFERIRDIRDKFSWDLKSIGEISGPPRYGTSERLTYLNQGVPFLRITDIQQDDFDPASICYISDEEAMKVSYATVRAGDLLISRSGTLGVTIAIRKDLSKSVFGSYFIRIRPNTDINREYLAVCLNSFFGKAQVEQMSTGALQTNLTIPAIKHIKILVPRKDFQDEVASLVSQSRESRTKATQLLRQAKREVELRIAQSSSSRN